ncbi:MAG: hypothetical protein FJX95_10945 [Bacteroidetes bacterium]|nr:hypothetical protein [Bacteroidota bacterium]
MIGGEHDLLGISVALSKNATTMVIGAYRNTSNTGYVQVYHKVDAGGNWSQLGPTIYGNGTDDFFGTSVDITADGTTIICGSQGIYYHEKYDRPGYVRVFKLESDGDIGIVTWVQIGQNITDEASYDGFGYYVSIADEGKTIVIGLIRIISGWVIRIMSRSIE